MTLDDKKHKKCAVCDKRLDRVKYWNIVQKEELILKLNKLKEGVKKNDSVCSTCTDRSRRLFVDNVETMQYDVESNQNDNYQNNQSTVLIQNDNISCEMNSEDIDDYSSECSSTTLGSTESIQDSIYVDLARTNSTEKKCVICNKKRGKKTINCTVFQINRLLMLI
jgi:hypothetical protein